MKILLVYALLSIPLLQACNDSSFDGSNGRKKQDTSQNSDGSKNSKNSKDSKDSKNLKGNGSGDSGDPNGSGPNDGDGNVVGVKTTEGGWFGGWESKKSFNPITCTKTDFISPDSAGGTNQSFTLPFTAGECGGKLPDDSMVGVLVGAEICGIEQSWVLHQPQGGQAPRVSFWYMGHCSGNRSPSHIKAHFIKKDDVKICRKTDFRSSPGGDEGRPINLAFRADECGGTLPDSSWIGAFAVQEVCGREESWVLKQPTDSSAPVAHTWFMGGCDSNPSPSDVTVVFVKRNDAVVCTKTEFDHPGGNTSRPFTINFNAEECGGNVPGAERIGLQSGTEICGQDGAWMVGDKSDVSFWYIGGCSGGDRKAFIQAVYLKK